MPEPRELQSVVDAAEQAAAAGDYASADALLREAALLQEASLGPLHPDLANTLNNLAVVCEILEKPVDAEHYFRRACAIATAVLDSNHPFVATSRKNLEDFCAARGRPVDAPSTGSDDRPAERPSYEASRPVASRRWTPPLAIGALIAAGLFLTFIATAAWFRSGEKDESSPGRPSVSRVTPATPAGSPRAGPIAPDAPAATNTKRGRLPGESPSLSTEAAQRRTTAASVPQPPLVAAAQLCRELSTGASRGSFTEWHCVPASTPVDPGSLLFYTRLKSPTATTIQHRWYRGDRLRQVVELTVRANTTDGYRTYSRQTVDSRGTGDWRVELRTSDGVLLHEERFVVR